MATKFGRGLNSLRVRFAIMSGTFTGAAAFSAFWNSSDLAWNVNDYALTGLVVLMAVAITYLMTGKLTRPIENLRASTDAIAAGDYETPVEVDCQCEVGGLADSFGKMVNRLNSNVARIRTLAYEDAITGLPNRAALEDVLEGQPGLTGAILFIDLDHFKQVNDAHGHAAGDVILREAAMRLLEQGLETGSQFHPKGADRKTSGLLLTQSSFFRFAGDEFVAILPGLGQAEAALVARRIIAAMSEPFSFDGQRIQIGASVGAAVLSEGACLTGDLIKFADMAMYEAKKLGRGQLVLFDEVLKDRAEKRARLTADFIAGLERDELEVHFQPKIRLSDGRISSVEALVRWQHPEFGLLYPGEFLAIASENGLLPKLGQQVMRKSAAHIRHWKKAGVPIVVAINVCPGQFGNEKFADSLILLCLSQQVSPSDFEIELTETVAMADVAKACLQLERLKAAGFAIAIDDYGIGYSNLSQLYRLPFDHLKIDRSIVGTIGSEPNAEVLVSSVIETAHKLGHYVTAEGVETGHQLAVLRQLGCDNVQGFLTGRPVPAAELTSLLMQQKSGEAASCADLAQKAAC